SRPHPFRGHRAVRHRRVRRDQPCAARACGRRGGMGWGAAPAVRRLPRRARRTGVNMIDKRLIWVLAPLAVLAGCGGETAEGRGAASNEVLEGTISDAMLPVDRVRSEPPLENPEAFAAARRDAGPAGDAAGEGDEGTADAEPAGES